MNKAIFSITIYILSFNFSILHGNSFEINYQSCGTIQEIIDL